jgi:hypothetical protein
MLRHLVEPCTVGEVLANESVRVLVRSALPGALGVAEVDRHLREPTRACGAGCRAARGRRQACGVYDGGARPHGNAKAALQGGGSTDSDHDEAVAPNVLDRQFTVARPNAAWVGDSTYLGTASGWVYLAVLIDLGSLFFMRRLASCSSASASVAPKMGRRRWGGAGGLRTTALSLRSREHYATSQFPTRRSVDPGDGHVCHGSASP